MARYVGTRIAEKPKKQKASPQDSASGQEAAPSRSASASREASPRRVLSRAQQRKRKKLYKRLAIVGVVLVLLVSMYLTVVYSNIPIIKKYRTLYIETALSTMDHQWLAYAFFPKSVIGEVATNMYSYLDSSKVDESKLPPAPSKTPSAPPSRSPSSSSAPTAEPSTIPGQDELLEMFPELDPKTFPKDLDARDLQISDIVNKGIKTTEGDAVWAIDMPNQLMILEVKGEGYAGKLAIVRDSSRVSLAANDLNGRGRTIANMCDKNGAVLGINASGFPDENGTGNGATAYGLVISNGKRLHDRAGTSYHVMGGFDYDDNFRMGTKLNTSNLRDAVEFYPIVVLNGESVVANTYNGIHPRTLIGQTADKSVLMLVVEGRQVQSLGITLMDCGKILLRYGAYNAMAMDGGSSSGMAYNGKMITKSSSPQAGGRYLPDAWIVRAPSDADE